LPDAVRNLISFKTTCPASAACCFFVKKELSHHGKVNCIFKNDSDSTESAFTADVMLLLDGALLDGAVIPELLNSRVLSRMRCDGYNTVKEPTLIISFGMSMLIRLGPERALDIAQRMRQLARLRQQPAKMGNAAEQQLTTIISGSGFDDL
jgi:hypothetical protein